MGWHYAALEDRFRRIAGVDGALAILDWDTAVMMPKKAAAERGEQLATLKRLSHELLTHAETGEQLAAAEARGRPRSVAAGQSARDAPQVPARPCGRAGPGRGTGAGHHRLRDDLARGARHSRTSPCWRRSWPRSCAWPARRRPSPVPPSGLSPYDALLDTYQPDLRDAAVVPLFDRLAAELPALVEAILARQAAAAGAAYGRPGPSRPPRQKELGQALMARLGFDFDAGRLDESAHPFCGGTPADIRITTRYSEDEIVSALMGVLHETGHALYEAGLPQAWRDQPVGEARGIAVHESQSLLIEMQACRSPAFIGFLGGELRAHLRRRSRPGRRTTCCASTAGSSAASSGSRPTRRPTRCMSSCAIAWSGS